MDENREEELRRLKARLAELEAEMVEAKVEEGADQTKTDADSSVRRTFALFAGLLGVVAVLVAASQCSSPELEPPISDSKENAVQEAVAAAKAADEAMANADAALAGVDSDQPPAPASDWRYRDTRDAMTDRLTRTACTTSTNRALLTWPYSPVTADLCIRQSPAHGLDVYVVLNGNGQIICRSYRNCTIRIRFGESAQQSFSAVDAADGSSNIVFVTNAQRFVAAAQSADTIKVQLTFYEAGDQVLEFDTANLEWPRPAVD